MSDARVWVATSDAGIAACFAVMQQMRTHLEAHAFLTRVRRQMAEGFALARLDVDGEPVVLAGFRIMECLRLGRFMYVDDLVTRADRRSRGHAQAMFRWLRAHAAAEGCAALELDSGVRLHPAHRFYLGQRLDITAHHFSMRLAPDGA